MPGTSKTSFVAADILEEKRQSIALLWAQRLSLQEPYRVRNLGLPNLLGSLPRVIDVLVETFRRGFMRDLFLPGGRFHTIAVEHARARYKQGLSSGQVIWEFHLLRREIWRVLHHELPPRYAAGADEIFELGELLDDVLDPLIEAAVGFFATLALAQRE